MLAEPVWDPQAHPTSWRAVWAYSRSRAVWDTKTLTAQENRARDVITGGTAARMPRFVKTTKGRFVLDEAALARARRLAGLKGYVTNIPATVMPASEVITSYHDLWHVEQSFRMSKTDLAARPLFARTRDAIEAHLTIVFTALGRLPHRAKPHRPIDPPNPQNPAAAALGDHRDQRRHPHVPARARPRRNHHHQRPAGPKPKALSQMT